MVSNVCTQSVSYLLILCAMSVSWYATKGQCQFNSAWVERSLGIYSDLSVALSKESGGTQLAPPDPIFFTQAVKNNPYVHPMFGHERFFNSQNTFHVAVAALHILLN